MSNQDLQTWGTLFPWLEHEHFSSPKIHFAGLNEQKHSLARSLVSLPIVSEESFLMIMLADDPNDFVAPGSMKRLTLGEMFQTIPDQVSIVQSDSPYISNSTKNLLLKHGWNKFYEFSGVFPSDISKLPGAGKKFSKELILTLVFEAANWSIHQGVPSSELASESEGSIILRNLGSVVSEDDGVEGDFYFSSPNSRVVNNHLNEFLFKCSLLGATSQSVSDLLGSPTFDRFKSSELQSIDVEGWFTGVSLPDIADLIAGFIESLGGREKTVLLARASIATPVTLDFVGEQLGVTRERVRQLQNTYRKDFKTYLYGEPILSACYEVFLDSVSGFSFVENLKNRIPFLSIPLEGTEISVLDFFVHMTADFEAFEGLISEESKTKFSKSIREFLDKISNDEETHNFQYFLEQFRVQFPRIEADDIEQMLRHNSFVPIFDYWLNNKASGIQDIAVAALKHVGEPRTPEELLELVDIDRSVNSFKNALLVDPRIHRTGVGKFGLVSWGLPAYTSISEAIAEYIDVKGSTHIEQLVNYLTATFDVAPGSVRAYASAYPFETANGYVKRTNIKAKAKKPLHRVKKVFRDGDAWLIRIPVTDETLRGSGTSLPPIFVDALGVSNKESKTFTRDSDSLNVTFPSLNLTMSSIKGLCSDVGAVEGDFVFVSFQGEKFDFWKVNLEVESTQGKLLEMFGCRNPSESIDVLSEVIRRLSLDPSSSASEVLGVIEKRKESEILDLINSQPNILNAG